jgi:amidase
MPTAERIAEQIRAGEVSCREVVEQHLDRIDRLDGRLNAVVTLDADGARRGAEAVDQAIARGERWSPLMGIPVTIKDSFETAGVRTTSSFEPFADHVPKRDATVVARLRRAGAVVLGKTNLPILATDFQTDSPVFGRTNNPWDVKRTCGGSSGGSAVAVATSMAALDVGSDLAGSIRIPSHFCGVFGLKPTEHRISGAGHIPDQVYPGSPIQRTVRHMGAYGPIARSVRDLRLALEVLAGPDAYRQVEVPPVPLDEGQSSLSGARVAWSAELGGVPCTEDTSRTLKSVVDRLARIDGCTVEEARPSGFDVGASWEAWGEIVGSELGASLPIIVRQVLRLQFRLMAGQCAINDAVVRGAGLSLRRYLGALARRDELIASVDAFFEDFDLWLLPVTPGPAFTHRKTGKLVEVGGRRLPYFLAAGAAYTCPFNLTGNPVVTIPAGRSDAGLPIGLQLVGRRWRDVGLLGLAEAIADSVTGPFVPPPVPFREA